MNELIDCIESANTIGIAGHVRPDGDCVGSTTALYNYILHNYPDKTVYLFLEEPTENLSSVIDMPVITKASECAEALDLFVALDAASSDRLGENEVVFNNAKVKFVIDHHKTNNNYGDFNIVKAHASSACEVLYLFLDEEKIDLSVAKSLYLGIICDTGVFKYSATSKTTMMIAGMLLEKGVDSTYIIDTAFYEKSFKQNKLLGRALNKACITEDGFLCYTVISLDDLKEFNCSAASTDGIVEQLRLTKGVELAMFIRQDGENFYKISLRAKKGIIDVSKIAVMYDGGGHSKAAGFNASGDIDTIVKDLIDKIYKLREA